MLVRLRRHALPLRVQALCHLVQHLAHLGRKLRLTDGFLEKLNAFFDPTLVDYGIAGITRHVNDSKIRAKFARSLDQVAAVLARQRVVR